jgi:predicted ArsR family transcriptional regulator
MPIEEKPTVEQFHAGSQPVRYRILKLLNGEHTPMYVTEISDKLKLDHRLVSFHLAAMLASGLVKGEWKVPPKKEAKGKVAKYYFLTEPGKKVAQNLGT